VNHHRDGRQRGPERGLAPVHEVAGARFQGTLVIPELGELIERAEIGLDGATVAPRRRLLRSRRAW
jgi:hypothetical protein